MKCILYKISILLFLLIFSCSTKEKSTPKVSVLPFETTFHVGFFGNIQTKTIDTTDYFVFSELTTRNKISVYDETGREINSLQLKGITDSLGENFANCKMINLNSFVLTTKHSEKIILIDSTGEITFQKNLQPLISSQKYSIIPVIHYADAKSIVVGLETNTYQKLTNSSSVDDFEDVNDKKFMGHQVASIKDFRSNKPKIKLSLNNIYSRFLTKERLAIEGTKFDMFSDEKQVLASAYIDSVYFFNNFRLSKVIKIHSNYFSTMIQEKASIREHLKDFSKYSKILIDNDYIMNASFSKNGVFVIIRGAKNEQENFPFSIVALNSDYEKIDEQKIDELTYHCSVYSSNKRNYILKKSEDLKTINFDEIQLK